MNIAHFHDSLVHVNIDIRVWDQRCELARLTANHSQTFVLATTTDERAPRRRIKIGHISEHVLELVVDLLLEIESFTNKVDHLFLGFLEALRDGTGLVEVLFEEFQLKLLADEYFLEGVALRFERERNHVDRWFLRLLLALEHPNYSIFHRPSVVHAQ